MHGPRRILPVPWSSHVPGLSGVPEVLWTRPGRLSLRLEIGLSRLATLPKIRSPSGVGLNAKTFLARPTTHLLSACPRGSPLRPTSNPDGAVRGGGRGVEGRVRPLEANRGGRPESGGTVLPSRSKRIPLGVKELVDEGGKSTVRTEVGGYSGVEPGVVGRVEEWETIRGGRRVWDPTSRSVAPWTGTDKR